MDHRSEFFNCMWDYIWGWGFEALIQWQVFIVWWEAQGMPPEAVYLLLPCPVAHSRLEEGEVVEPLGALEEVD